MYPSFSKFLCLLALFYFGKVDCQQKRIRDYGVHIGVLPTGTLNSITDVAGVSVGHVTRIEEKISELA